MDRRVIVAFGVAVILTLLSIAVARTVITHREPGLAAVAGSQAIEKPHPGNARDQSADKDRPVERKGLLERTAEDPVALFTALLTVFTGLLFLATCGLWYMAVRQGSDTREGILAARRSAEAAERASQVAEDTLIAGNRAWLKAKAVASDQPLIFGSGGISFSVSVSAENVGNAPALHVEPHAWLLIWRSEAGKDPFTEHERRLRAVVRSSGGHTMFPGETFPQVTQVNRLSLGLGLSAEEVQAGLAASGGHHVMLYIGGCIAYTSAAVSDKLHRTAFFYEVRTINLSPIDPGTGRVPPQALTLVVPPFGQGNDAT